MCFSHLLADAAAEKTAMMVERLLADLPTPLQRQNQERLDRFWSGADTVTKAH